MEMPTPKMGIHFISVEEELTGMFLLWNKKKWPTWFKRGSQHHKIIKQEAQVLMNRIQEIQIKWIWQMRPEGLTDKSEH